MVWFSDYKIDFWRLHLVKCVLFELSKLVLKSQICLQSISQFGKVFFWLKYFTWNQQCWIFNTMIFPNTGCSVWKKSKRNGCRSETVHILPCVSKAKMRLRGSTFFQLSKIWLHISAVCLQFFKINFLLLDTFWIHYIIYTVLEIHPVEIA